MRLSEMLKIKVSDILDNSGFEITIIGKWDKIRPVYFNQEIKNLTEEYVRFRNEKTIISAWSGHARKMQGSGELLFIRHDDYWFWKGISKSTISWMFKKYREEIDFKKRVSCHTIRHSFWTRVVRKTDNVRIAQELLGHSSIISTQRYTHITNRELFTAHKRIFMD
jgi:integrase/recombinase XerD